MVPLVRIFLLAAVTAAVWRAVSDLKPPKPSVSAEVSKGPELPRIRAVYPLSLVPGGIRSDDDLENARASDPLLAAHYVDVGFLRPAFLTRDTLLYASFRQGSAIVWTNSRILIHAGEAVLSDRSGNLIRGRCGNRLSQPPRQPVAFADPAQSVFDAPEISFPAEPLLPIVSADHLAMVLLPAFPPIEEPRTAAVIPPPPASALPGIPTMSPNPRERYAETLTGPELTSIPGPGPPPARVTAPEPGTGIMLWVGGAVLIAFIFRAVCERN